MPKSDKKKYNFLDCLPDIFVPHKTRIELLVSEELGLFSSRLESALLREIATPHGHPPSMTTSVNRVSRVPEALSLDGISHDSKSSDLSKQLISVQVREYHMVDTDVNNPTPIYTISSAFAGGYHATVYRMQQDIDALYKMFGRRARVERFVVPATGGPDALKSSCSQLRTYLLRILRCPTALGNKKLFAWFGLDRAFASTRDDEVLMNAFEDIWRLYYSDEDRVFTDTPEDMLTLYLTSRVRNATESSFAELKKQGGMPAVLQCLKCIMLYIRNGVCDTWAEWRTTTPVLMRKFSLLPGDEFEEAVNEVLEKARKPISDDLVSLVDAVKTVLGILTPLVKAVRHTMREYRPHKVATMTYFLTAQPETLADSSFENLENNLGRVKSKVKGALEYVARTYEKELQLNLRADEGEDSAVAKLIPFMRKIPTIARALFYLSQPAVMVTFTKNFLREREKLCRAGPTSKAKDRSAIDAFADRMRYVLTFIERDLSFSDSCVKNDFTDELLSTHSQDKSLPNNSRFSHVLREFYVILSRLVTYRVQFFVNMTKMFVNTVNDMGLDAVVSLQLRIAMVRSASQTAFAEANAIFERQLKRQIPEMVSDLMAALIFIPAKETLEKNNVLTNTALEIPRAKDPAFNVFLDVNNLVSMALAQNLRAAVKPVVDEWYKTNLDNRVYDPKLTADAVAERRKRRHRTAQLEPMKAKQPAAPVPVPVPANVPVLPVGTMADAAPKKGKAKKAAEPEPEPEPEPKAEPEPAPKAKAKKAKKVAVPA